MRATTFGTLKMCLATCEAMMLRLSPSVTATKPSASSMPARRRTSASVPLPTTWLPLKSLVRMPREAARENWLGSRSMITTSWPALSISAASWEPTRPQPTMRSFKALDYREAPPRSRVAGAGSALARIWTLALPIHVHGLHGARHWGLGCGVPGRPSRAGSCRPGHRRGYCSDLVELRPLRPGQARATRPAALMADHSHSPMSKKVLVAVGGQGIDPETVRLACRMTDPQGGRLYGVHIIEVNRSLPLGAVLDDVVERGEKILEEVEQLAAETNLPVEWGADLIVMGLPYKRRFGEFNLGKTVPYVLKNATCRVMLFREHREQAS